VPGINRPKAEDVVQAGIEALTELNVLAHNLRNQISRENDAEESLHLIAKFFARCGYLDIAQHLGRIALAFYDRSEGISDPLLSRREKNKEDSTQKWRGRMWAALGYECLHQAKQSKPAEYTERHYPQLAATIARESSSPDIVARLAPCVHDRTSARVTG
jgi:hypothetical protein